MRRQVRLILTPKVVKKKKRKEKRTRLPVDGVKRLESFESTWQIEDF